MSRATIRIPTPLRPHTGGADEVVVTAATVDEALRELEERHPGLMRYVLDEAGDVRRFVNLYVGDRDIRHGEGLRTPLADGAVLSVIPAVAGGQR